MTSNHVAETHPFRIKCPMSVPRRLRQILPCALIGISLLLVGRAQAADFAQVAEALARLPVTTRMLYITAHPDDETPGVLTYLARGLGARVAILSLTRGEGGQNLVGREREEALGLLRTGELLAASRRYGCELYFTRAYDFGFTKSAEETLARWGEQEITGDIVARIRQFRPHIVIARWTGMAADRHGQHQAAGILARKAYAAAADTTAFPAELFGAAWQPDGLYLQVRELGPGEIPIPVDTYSLLLGGTFHEFGVVGFSEHRTQGMAAAASRYPRWKPGLRPLETTRPGAQPREAAELVETLRALPQRYPAVNAALPGFQASLEELMETLGTATARLSAAQPTSVVPLLVSAARQLRTLAQRLGSLQAEGVEEVLAELQAKQQATNALIAEILGLRLGATTESADWVAGESYRVRVRVENAASAELRVDRIELEAPAGWTIVPAAAAEPAPAGETQFVVSVPAKAPITQPYWKLLKPTDGRYVYEQQEFAGLPFPPPLVGVRAHWRLLSGELEGTLRAPVESIGGDSLRGSLRRSVLVVPVVTVEVLPARRLITTRARAAAAEFAVRTRYFGSGTADVACVGSPMPPGWEITWDIKAAASVHFSGPRQQALSRLHLTPAPATSPGLTKIPISARLGSEGYPLWQQEIVHPEVTTRYRYGPAQAEVELLDLRVPARLRVGYIAGENDPVPDALEQPGIEVAKLDELHLTLKDLSRYDAIVVGIQAYELRPDLARLNQRLLDYVARGGTLLVQYQLQCDRGARRSCVWKRTWNELDPAPFPAEMSPEGNERITDEHSPVRLLAPDHPLFSFPNKITSVDFDGWVDERGLYFWKQWDGRYTPLLALRDPGEEELLGGLLVAQHGQGLYIYTGLSFFRQLPAGVPGAFRLFVNLLSAGRKDARRK